MLFTEIIFIPFLIGTFVLFGCCRRSRFLQLVLLLIASYIFYGWWRVELLFLIVFSSCLDFFVGRAMGRSDDPKHRRQLLAMSLIGNLGLLAYFKYMNFFLESLSSALSGLGLSGSLPTLNIILPVGISFYTFQSLSYTIDIYQRKIQPTDSLLEFLVFVASFPQLVAGPIVRAREFLPQLRDNLCEKCDESGLFYILYGLAKKLFVADILGSTVVDPVFADPASFTAADLSLALYGYAFQIFFDFSAYSDIAIGLGKIFGLQLPVNFRSPYLARNPSEFWQRWHITLSTWFRDYLYIPLGGNQFGTAKTLRNLFIVMLLAGLWHGANWTFVIWGGVHGLLLVVYRISEGLHRRIPGFFQTAIFFVIVCLTWVLFRSANLSLAMEYYQGIWSGDWRLTITNMRWLIAIVGGTWWLHTGVEPRIEKLAKGFTHWHWSARGGIVYVFCALIALLSELNLTHQAFIYFQF